LHNPSSEFDLRGTLLALVCWHRFLALGSTSSSFSAIAMPLICAHQRQVFPLGSARWIIAARIPGIVACT
jgi:hypothetical protein